jgi:hypothetical protein
MMPVLVMLAMPSASMPSPSPVPPWPVMVPWLMMVALCLPLNRRG